MRSPQKPRRRGSETCLRDLPLRPSGLQGLAFTCRCRAHKHTQRRLANIAWWRSPTVRASNSTPIRFLRVNAARKTAWLDHGEVFFEVHHDAAHPFVVMAGDKRITDVGTKFIVRRDGDRFEADVVEGRVQFDADDAHKHTLLKQGDTVVADANSVVMPKKSSTDLARELGWRRGVLIFDATPLGDAAAEFNRYNADKIIIADDATARLSLGGTFRTNDGEAFIRLAQQVLGLRVKHYPNETVISR